MLRGFSCREPHLLWFGLLFVELIDEIVPLVVDYDIDMFYKTTMVGHNFMDPEIWLKMLGMTVFL